MRDLPKYTEDSCAFFFLLHSETGIDAQIDFLWGVVNQRYMDMIVSL